MSLTLLMAGQLRKIWTKLAKSRNFSSFSQGRYHTGQIPASLHNNYCNANITSHFTELFVSELTCTHLFIVIHRTNLCSSLAGRWITSICRENDTSNIQIQQFVEDIRPVTRSLGKREGVDNPL